jgi:hypothetical protein
VSTISGGRKVDFGQATKHLGPEDALFVWKKPAKKSALVEQAQWDALGDLTVRILRITVEKKGARTKHYTVVTTLLDPFLYPAHEIIAAHARRWRMEMCLDDLKTTLGMENLQCRTPSLVQKELRVFLIAHNLVRWLMASAATQENADLERVSFKGSLDGFRQWSQAIAQCQGPRKRQHGALLWKDLLRTLVADAVPLRPGRTEPRAVKKRSKYPHLNRPRQQYVPRWSRNKRRSMALAKRKAQAS